MAVSRTTLPRWGPLSFVYVLLVLWLCFEGKYSVVAGLVHAFDSWQRCV